jgi:carbon storage regulator
MLVLTRRPEDGLVLTLPGSGERIVITVLGVEGDKVKLGIAAPKTVTVLRQELCDAVREQNLASVHSAQAPAAVAPDLLRQLFTPRTTPPDAPAAPDHPQEPAG